jgi:fermentation-respiration switch protein FrsA (DUF1100 family)
MNTVGKAALLLGALALALCCQGCVGKMFYYPDKTVHDTPDKHGLKYEEVTFFSKDGTRLSGWFVPAVGEAKGTVVHFHGNDQNMTSHFGFVSWLPAEGFNLFLFDYRGYGTSEGKPDRQGLYDDSLGALDYIEQRPGMKHNRLLVLGQSLGGANAIVALGSKPRPTVRAVAIDSSFSSYRWIVRDKMAETPPLSWFSRPLSYTLVRDGLSPQDYVGRIAPTPLLIMHGTADTVIPYHHGRHLFDLAGQPKYFWSIKGGTHTSALEDPASSYRKKLVEFFNEALECSTVTARPVVTNRQ